MLECLNGGLEGLGGLESLEGKGNREGNPLRMRLNHRGPLSIDVASAWYFITICAKNHALWSMRDDPVGRDDPIAPDEFKKVLPTK